MKNLSLLVVLGIILSSCGSYRTKVVDPSIPNNNLVVEKKNPFTNIFSFSESNLISLYKKTGSNILCPGKGFYINVTGSDVASNPVLCANDASKKYIKRTFADFFFYNQIVLSVPSSVSPNGIYGLDAIAYLVDSPPTINPLGDEEKAYWSSTQIINNQTVLKGLPIINNIAPMELPSIDEAVLKIGLAIDENGYIDKTVGRILVGLVTSDEIISVRLDLRDDMTITSSNTSKEITAVFADMCASVNFKGTMTNNTIGERVFNNVSLSFVNNADSYKNTGCLYNGSFKKYANGNPSIDNINFPYTRSGTANNTTNINPYKVVIKAEANSKNRVLFDGVNMEEIIEE